MITNFDKYYSQNEFDPSQERVPGYMEKFRQEVAEEEKKLYKQFREDIESDYDVTWWPQNLLDRLFELSDQGDSTLAQVYQEYGRLVSLIKLCQEEWQYGL